ncbi:MAG: CPBP family intramembrane glutamic endopeptidase [Prolixibacteraceae bacterium]
MESKKAGFVSSLSSSLMKGGLATLGLTILFLFYTIGKCPVSQLLLALPFFVIFYFVQFTLGSESAILAIRQYIQKGIWHVLIFPTAMLILYFIYLLLNDQNILLGNPGLLVYIIYFPVLVFAFKNEPGRKIGWLDFTVFILTLLPTALISLKQNSDLPINGPGFDSISHLMIILSGVYSFAIVRGVKEVGFVFEINSKSLQTALLVWLAFYAFVFVFGRSVDFIDIIGYSDPFDIVLKSILFTVVGTFLHTALFEELFFRGILQNLLTKRIGQGKSWLIFWQIGFLLLFIGALVVGYTLDGKMKWFPALVTVVLFVSAYLIEKSGKYGHGVYTALAITGVTFGLVHYHAKSIIYIGLACIAGWAYGYTYLKTKNVFYSALVHTLVNTGVLIFGLKMMR